MTAHARPRRQRKGDRLLNPGTSQAEIRCDYALAPLDRLALDMDMVWGIDRLPELVSPDTAEKYGFSIGKLNAAVNDTNPEDVKAWAAVCMRGLLAMDAEARKLGRKPAAGNYTEHEIDGWKFAILHDGAEWKTAKAARTDLQFFTLREVGVALKASGATHPIVDEIKNHFPTAKVTAIRPRTKLEQDLDDEIPF